MRRGCRRRRGRRDGRLRRRDRRCRLRGGVVGRTFRGPQRRAYCGRAAPTGARRRPARRRPARRTLVRRHDGRTARDARTGLRARRDGSRPSATLQPVESRREPGHAVIRRRQQQPRDQQLEVQPGGGRARHLAQGVVDQVGGPGELGCPQVPSLDAHRSELVRGELAEDRARRVAGGRDDDQVADAFEEVLHEPARLVAGADDPLDHPERARTVARRDRTDEVVEQGHVRVAEERDGALVVDPGGTGAGDELVEDRQRIAHGPRTRADDEREDAGAHRDTLGRAHLREVVDQDVRGHEPERVVVGPRPDRADDLVRLGRREHELHVRRRLLDDLEQGVEALRRDHVRLVEDEDLVAVPSRRERGPLAELPRVVDTTVARGVDLDHVEAARAAARQLDARGAHPARRVRRMLGRVLDAVQDPREDPRRARLPAPAGAGEQVGVVHLAGPQRLPERPRDVLLTDHLGEVLRAIAAVQRSGHPRTLEARPDVVLRRRGRPSTARAHR